MPTPKPTVIPITGPRDGYSALEIKGLKLHGIGSGGDNPNPKGAGTNNPSHFNRGLTVEIYDTSGTLATSVQGTITYNKNKGDFSGTAQLPNNLTTGSYTIKVKSPGYLRKQIPGFINFIQGKLNSAGSVALIAGDIDGDNQLNISDYDQIMDCYSDLLPPKNCDATKKLRVDLSDDGKVNQYDYNLFLRELSVQQGK